MSFIAKKNLLPSMYGRKALSLIIINRRLPEKHEVNHAARFYCRNPVRDRHNCLSKGTKQAQKVIYKSLGIISNTNSGLMHAGPKRLTNDSNLSTLSEATMM